MNKKKNTTTRRDFLASTGLLATGLTLGVNRVNALGYKRVPGANERIRIGFIGVGNRGSQLMQAFMMMEDCEVAALCDVYEPYLSRARSKVDPRYIRDRPAQVPAMGEVFPNKVERYADYRRMLENKSVDAVVIATPDHWHALQTIHAVQAGKDVYLEKPVSKTVTEGRAMVRAAAASKQVVTVGLNRRSASMFRKLAIEIPAGRIGKVTFASACHVGNMYPAGIGKMKAEEPPAGFDWDAWLGPRAFRPYQYNIAPYMFRWWEDYSNQIGNNGVHYLDLMRWMMNETAPVSVQAGGGKFAVDDDRTIPDTMQVTYEYASGALVSVNILEASSGSFVPYGFIEMRGTKGTLLTAENDYRIVPTQPGQFQSWDKLMEPETVSLEKDDKRLTDGSYRDSTANMVRNFLDCVRSRQTPFCTLEEGHRSTTLAHMATIAMVTGEKLKWDSVQERFTNSEKANRMLAYEYRKPYIL